MNCCEHHNINCNQGRDCPLRAEETDPARGDRKPSDIWIILAIELAPILVVGIAAGIGGRIAGLW